MSAVRQFGAGLVKHYRHYGKAILNRAQGPLRFRGDPHKVTDAAVSGFLRGMFVGFVPGPITILQPLLFQRVRGALNAGRKVAFGRYNKDDYMHTLNVRTLLGNARRIRQYRKRMGLDAHERKKSPNALNEYFGVARDLGENIGNRARSGIAFTIVSYSRNKRGGGFIRNKTGRKNIAVVNRAIRLWKHRELQRARLFNARNKYQVKHARKFRARRKREAKQWLKQQGIERDRELEKMKREWVERDAIILEDLGKWTGAKT